MIEMRYLLSVQGYVRGKNLHGAPYDFRRAANEHGEYFERLKSLVEDTFTKENPLSLSGCNFVKTAVKFSSGNVGVGEVERVDC